MVLMGALCLFRRVLDSDRNSIIERATGIYRARFVSGFRREIWI